MMCRCNSADSADAMHSEATRFIHFGLNGADELRGVAHANELRVAAVFTNAHDADLFCLLEIM